MFLNIATFLLSSSSNWIEIYQQVHPFQVSTVNFSISQDSSTLTGTTKNVAVIDFDLTKAAIKYPAKIVIDNQEISIDAESDKVYSALENDKWIVSEQPSKTEKGPHRNGNFKDAFRHNIVFVYGTSGSKEANKWNYYKARYDAESFSYRGNGSIEIISDKQFDAEKYANRGVIIYGNADNNSAWKLLLKNP